MSLIKKNIKQMIGRSLDQYTKTHLQRVNDRIDNIAAQAGTDNTEVVDARIDTAGVKHTTLNNRLKAETKIMGERLVDVSGEYITVEGTVPGPINAIKIIGQTIQNPDDLSDIKSVGDLQEDGQYKMSILSSNKNLLGDIEIGRIDVNTGEPMNGGQYTRTIDFIKVKPNMNLKLSFKYIGTDRSHGHMSEYDSNKKFVKDTYVTNGSFVTGSTTKFIKITLYSGISTPINLTDITNPQLEEGTVATSYVEPRYNKSSILMPCQLGNEDRLYYDKGEKAWCIDKVEATTVLNGSENWLFIDNGKVYSFHISLPNCKRDLDRTKVHSLNNLYTTSTYNEGVLYNKTTSFMNSANPVFYVNIEKDGATITNLHEWKTMLNTKNIILKHPSSTPQKIVLPKTTQIELNSHLDTTHIYTLDTEIEPTIKAKVSKSMGASVESLHNKTYILEGRVADIEGLKSSQDMKYQTDKGYLVCSETQDGVVKDVKIKGKTLNNILPSNFPISSNFIRVSGNSYKTTFPQVTANAFFGYKVENGKTYTFKTNIDTSKFKMALFKVVGESLTNITGYKQVDTYLYNCSESIDEIRCYVHSIGIEPETLIKYLVLEGDHTQNPPSHFEVMQSVGEDVDKIEVLSNNENLLNPLNEFSYIPKTSKVIVTENSVSTSSTVWEGYYTHKIFVGKGGFNYSFDVDYPMLVVILDENDKILRELVNDANNGNFKTLSGTLASETDYIKVQYRYRAINNTLGTAKNMYISKTATNYTLPKQDKKAILYRDNSVQVLDKDGTVLTTNGGEWKPVPCLHEWDLVDSLEGKWYKRSCKELTSLTVFYADVTNTDELSETGKYLVFKDTKTISSKIICDKFNTFTSIDTFKKSDSEGVFINQYGLSFKVLKTRLATPDAVGWKGLLQQWTDAGTPCTVVYLVSDEVFDIAPLNLDTYANKTMISLSSGAIVPYVEFSITTYISNMVNTNRQDIKRLQNDFYKYSIVQNKLMLDGRYTADSAIFRMDIASAQTESNMVNDGVYDLIYKNVIIGVDNYDRTKMELMITDYFMWFVIDFDMYIELLDIIENQHNPAVEEIPEEII